MNSYRSTSLRPITVFFSDLITEIPHPGSGCRLAGMRLHAAVAVALSVEPRS